MRVHQVLPAAAAFILALVLCLSGVRLIQDPLLRGDLIAVAAMCSGFLGLLACCRRLRPQIALIFFSVIAGGYLIEMGLAIVVAAAKMKTLGIGPVQTARKLREAGTNVLFVFQELAPTNHSKNKPDLIPISGISKAHALLGVESGRPAVYFTDEFGFCNPSGWSDLGVGRTIAIVGDSFVQGCSVDPDETLAARLNNRVDSNRHHCVSLGLASAGPLTSLGMIVEYLRPTKPPCVFWCYFEGNDLQDLSREAQTGLIRYLQDPSYCQGLWHRQDEVDAYKLPRAEALFDPKRNRTNRSNPLPMHWLTLRGLRTHLAYHLNPPPMPVEPHWIDEFSNVLGRAKMEVESWGGKLFFVYLPEIDRYLSPRRKDFASMHAFVTSAASDHGLSVIDLHREMFLPTKTPLAYFPVRRNSHYTAEGYDKAAEIMSVHLPPSGKAAGID